MDKEDRVREKIRTIELKTDKVRKNLPSEFTKFEEMDLEKDGLYKNVEIAIQSSYDICAIIAREEGLEVPHSEESIPDLLRKEDILSKETCGNVKDMKGFRNALAHKYGEIKDKIAFENINEGLKDFHKFIREIERYLDNK